MKIKIIDVIRIRALIADVTASFKMGQKQEKEDESSYRAIVATPNASISVDWVNSTNSTKYNLGDLGAVFIDLKSECGSCKIILNKGSASLDFNDKTYVLYKGDKELAELKSLVIATLKEITKIADIVESIILEKKDI